MIGGQRRICWPQSPNCATGIRIGGWASWSRMSPAGPIKKSGTSRTGNCWRPLARICMSQCDRNQAFASKISGGNEVAKWKSPTPFCDDDFVYFELQSPNFRVLDHYNEGGSYSVRQFQPGIYRLPIDAICPATMQEQRERADEIITVDTCQIFIVDSAFVAKFRECLDMKEGAWPNYPYFERLRKEVGVDFGHANVNSDGNYVLDLSTLTRIDSDKAMVSSDNRSKEDLYEKVARHMRTFVCERCFEEELTENGETYQELARLAKDQGWHLAPPEGQRDRWFFEEFQVVGPKCEPNAVRSTNQLLH